MKLFKKKDKALTRLQSITIVFGIMKRLIKDGLLYWDRRHRRLFIAAPIAIIYMSQGKEKWAAFLNNVYLYISYTHQQEQWQKLLQRKQNKAVADAQKQNPALTRMDMQRIRRATADSLMQDEVPTPPLEAFEFYVVSDTDDAKAQTTIVGSYNPDTQLFTMVAWEDVQKAIAATKEK